MEPFDPDAFLRGAPAVDPLKAAFGRRTPEPLYADSLYDGRGQLTPEQIARMSAGPSVEAPPASSGDFDPDEFLGLGEAPGKLESLGRGALQGVSFGFSDEITGAIESAFTDKTYERARNESRAANKKAKDENPWSYGIGEVAGGIGGAAATGGAGLAARAGLTGVKAAVALGAAEGALAGAGTSEGGIDETIKDALIGGASGGALAGAAGKIFGKYVAGSERAAVRNVTKELTEGAIPTQARRFARVGDLGFDILEPDKAFMKAAKSRPEKAKEIASDRLGDLAPQTKPIYRRLDNDVGKVPLSDWGSHFDDLISSRKKDFGADDRVTDALEATKKAFEAKAIAKYGKKTDKGVSVEIPHEDVRDFVTQKHKEAIRKLGTIGETENAQVALEAWEAADDFLKGRLASYRTSHPNVSGDLDNLTDLNRKIKAWASAEELMSHKEGREFWKRGGLEAIASGKMGQFGAMAGVGAAVATGNPFAAAIGLVPKGVSSVAKAAGSVDRAATSALAKLSKAAREGDLTKAQYLEALKQGVAASTAAGILAGMRNRPAWSDEVTDGTGE
jgi:hypothetical protein